MRTRWDQSNEWPSAGRVLRLLTAVAASAALAAGINAAAQPAADPGAAPTGGIIGGTATWDIELVREYIKKQHEVDMAAEPQPYPGQAMLAQVNPEFALRINALMAVYQAHGGTDLGLVPRTGGLRTAQQQADLYRKCRRIQTGANGQPVGDGSQKAHYEVIPQAQRTAANCPDGDTVTALWVGWHNLGVAVDFGVFQNGKYVNDPLPQTEAWRYMVDAGADLGLVWGGWFPWDPAHFEWHPKLTGPETVPGEVSGTALRDDQVHPGYLWQLAETVFQWSHDPANPQSDTLWARQFGVDGNWVVLKKQRTIAGRQDGEWSGTWASFDPPIRLFPAYIPTVALSRNESTWPDDAKWRGQSQVTTRSHYRHVSSDGSISTQDFEESGRFIYRPDLRMTDLQKEAIAAIGQHTGMAPQYTWLKDNSVYSIELRVEPVEAGEASMQTITLRNRDQDSDGYTDDASSEREGWLQPSIYLPFSWNRDTGQVGLQDKWMWVDHIESVFRPREKSVGDAGQVLVVSGQLPDGAWDQEEPTSWPEENPKPDGHVEPTDGFLRP